MRGRPEPHDGAAALATPDDGDRRGAARGSGGQEQAGSRGVAGAPFSKARCSSAGAEATLASGRDWSGAGERTARSDPGPSAGPGDVDERMSARRGRTPPGPAAIRRSIPGPIHDQRVDLEEALRRAPDAPSRGAERRSGRDIRSRLDGADRATGEAQVRGREATRDPRTAYRREVPPRPGPGAAGRVDARSRPMCFRRSHPATMWRARLPRVPPCARRMRLGGRQPSPTSNCAVGPTTPTSRPCSLKRRAGFRKRFGHGRKARPGASRGLGPQASRRDRLARECGPGPGRRG